MQEGFEVDEFWKLLGGKSDYASSPRLQVTYAFCVLSENLCLAQYQLSIKNGLVQTET